MPLAKVLYIGNETRYVHAWEAAMLVIEKVDTRNRKQVSRFLNFPFQLYENHPQWVPPLLIDTSMHLKRDRHPFYEHSDADFFIAVRDGRDVGRVAALENRAYNRCHDAKQAQFYLFDSVEDQEVADRLLESVIEWARGRGLNRVVGPKGFSSFDGYGILVEGFEHRQMMNMMNYNYPYYPKLVEGAGFTKEVDFVSCFLSAEKFIIQERIHRIGERVQQRGTLEVHRFQSKNDLKVWAERIGKAYNQAFVNNWEYYPLTTREIQFVLDSLLQVADPKMVKIITHKEDVVGFVLAFPDVSEALKKARGRLLPFGILHVLREIPRTPWVSLNGAGILPEFQGHGGNALLYCEMEKTIRSYEQFKYAELTQVAETAVQMRRDLENIGGKPYKNHRVYQRSV
jgi:GNAT superfamily N-acetyltransferase